MEQAARQTLASLSVRTVTSVRMPVASLSGGQRQTVAIAKAVLWDSKVVLLDEPTAALGVAQTRQVLDLVRRLAEQGLGVVLISHNMADVFEVSDRIAMPLPGPDGRPGAHQGRHPRPGRRADHRGPLGRARPAASGERDRLMAAPTEEPQKETSPGGPARTPPAASAAERAGPASSRSADFGIDTTAKTTGEAIRGYLTRLRNGDLGSLPALLGLLALFILFTALDSGGTFPSLLNLANLLQQGAGQHHHRDGPGVRAAHRRDRPGGRHRVRPDRRGDGAAPGARRQPARRDGHHGVRPVRARSWWSPSCWRVLLRIWAGAACRALSRCSCWSSGSRRTRGWRCCSRSASAS